MADQSTTLSTVPTHGASRLPSVNVDSYNAELKDDEGFLGDRASKGAFRKILDGLRKPLRKNGDDPLGKKSTCEIPKGSSSPNLLRSTWTSDHSPCCTGNSAFPVSR